MVNKIKKSLHRLGYMTFITKSLRMHKKTPVKSIYALQRLVKVVINYIKFYIYLTGLVACSTYFIDPTSILTITMIYIYSIC